MLAYSSANPGDLATGRGRADLWLGGIYSEPLRPEAFGGFGGQPADRRELLHRPSAQYGLGERL